MTKTDIVAKLLRANKGKPVAAVTLMREAKCLAAHSEVSRCRHELGMSVKYVPKRHPKTGRVLESRYQLKA